MFSRFDQISEQSVIVFGKPKNKIRRWLSLVHDGHYSVEEILERTRSAYKISRQLEKERKYICEWILSEDYLSEYRFFTDVILPEFFCKYTKKVYPSVSVTIWSEHNSKSSYFAKLPQVLVRKILRSFLGNLIAMANCECQRKRCVICQFIKKS